MATANPNLHVFSPEQHHVATRPMPNPFVHRRPSREQGMALEKLAHAIEYLVDSRSIEAGVHPGGTEAVLLLMRSSRDLFAQCKIVVPTSERLRRWVHRTLPFAPAPSPDETWTQQPC